MSAISTNRSAIMSETLFTKNYHLFYQLLFYIDVLKTHKSAEVHFHDSHSTKTAGKQRNSENTWLTMRHFTDFQ